MTTIRLKRSDQFAIHLEFDSAGASSLLHALTAAANGSENSISIQFDHGVTKRKRYPGMTKRNMAIVQAHADAIEEVGDDVRLMVEQHTLAYAMSKLQECLETNRFEPAELCELSIVGGPDVDNDLYCIFLKSQWGLFPWFPEHGTDMIHPEDIEATIAMQPSGKVFKRVGTQGDFITLSYGEQRIRVKPDLFRVVDAPSKQIGDRVSLEKDGRVMTAVVVEINWHYKQAAPFYTVEIDGKRVSKRYWERDLF